MQPRVVVICKNSKYAFYTMIQPELQTPLFWSFLNLLSLYMQLESRANGQDSSLAYADLTNILVVAL